MPTAFLPSAKDKAVLQKLIARENRRIEAAPPQVTRLGWLDGTDHHPPEVYVAYPQSATGIPALTRGADDDPDEPGSDDCDIYKINPDGELVEPDASFSKVVHNLTTTSLPQDWMTVTRTKYGKWMAIVSGSPNPIQLFEITSAGVYDVTTKEWYYTGVPVVFNTDTDLYEVQGDFWDEMTWEEWDELGWSYWHEFGAENLWHPTAFREDLTDDSPSDSAAKTQVNFHVGQRVYVEERANRYEIISPPLNEWRFELYNDLAPNGTAQAYFRRWTGADWVTDTDIEITVEDRDGKFRGRGKGTYDGFRGVARYWPDSNKWEIIECQGYAEEIEVTLTEDMGESVANRASCTVDDHYCGEHPDPGDDGILVYDPQDHFLYALDTAKAKATYDLEDNRYVLRVCQTKAKHIVVTLNEDMGETDSDVSYSATVQDFWEGQNPSSPQHVWDTNSEFAGTLSGDTLHARWDEIDGKYRVISEAGSTQHEIWFTANNDMAAGTSAAATVDRFIGNDPGGTVNVLDPDGADGRWKYVLDGSEGHAVRHGDGEYYITYSTVQAKHIRFVLTQDMQAGSPKRATSTTSQIYDGISPGNVTVYDDAALFPLALDTARGYATFDEASDEYIITNCQQQAAVVSALINEGGGVATTDGTFNVDNVEVCLPFDGQSPGATLTAVRNVHAFEGDNNGRVELRYNITDGEWDCTQMDCKA